MFCSPGPFLVALLMLVGACLQQQLREEPCLPHCLECNQNNYCLKCEEGYFLLPIRPGAVEGFCMACTNGCRICLNDQECLECFSGFAQDNPACPRCEKGCMSCNLTTSNCTTCASNYIHQSNNLCYFKYTIHIIIGGIAILLLLALSCRFCYTCLLRKHQLTTFFPESVLDRESMKNTYYVHHLTKIGQTEEENEISKVHKLESDPNERFFQDRSVAEVLGDSLVDPTKKKK